MPQFAISFIRLHAFHQTEEDGDELFLKLDGRKIWPSQEKFKRVGKGAQIDIGYSKLLEHDNTAVKLELWEYDNFFSSQCLGSFHLSVNEIPGGPYVTDLKMSSGIFARYSLEWRLVAQ